MNQVYPGNFQETVNYYKYQEACDASKTFKDAAKNAKFWNYLWNTLYWICGGSIWLFSLLLLIDGQIKYLDGSQQTTISAFIMIVKIFEQTNDLKGKSSTANIVYRNYTTISEKIENAVNVLKNIKSDGITDKEIKDWNKMIKLIDKLIEETKYWPSSTVLETKDVKLALENIKNVQKSILEQQQQKIQNYMTIYEPGPEGLQHMLDSSPNIDMNDTNV